MGTVPVTGFPLRKENPSQEKKKEQLLARDRPADRRAVLVLSEGRRGHVPTIVEEGIRVQYLVADVLIGAAVKAVGTGSGGHIHDAAGEAAELGADRVAVHAELADRVLHGHQRRTVDVTGIERHAVEVKSALVGHTSTDLVVSKPGVVGQGAIGLVADGIAAYRTLRHDAGGKLEQIEDISAVQGHLLHHLALYGLA